MLFSHSVSAFSILRDISLSEQVKGAGIIVIATIKNNAAKKIKLARFNRQIQVECRIERILKGNIENTFSFTYTVILDETIPFKKNVPYLLFLQRENGKIALRYKDKSLSAYDLSTFLCRTYLNLMSVASQDRKKETVYVTPDFLVKRVIYIISCYKNKKEIQYLLSSLLSIPVLGQEPDGEIDFNLEDLRKKAFRAFKKGDLMSAKAYCDDVLIYNPYDKQIAELLREIFKEEYKIDDSTH